MNNGQNHREHTIFKIFKLIVLIHNLFYKNKIVHSKNKV